MNLKQDTVNSQKKIKEEEFVNSKNKKIDVHNEDLYEVYALIYELFSERKHIGKARQGLAKFIKGKYDIILRKNTRDTYILDNETNSYTRVTFDELFVKVSHDLGENLINEEDLKEAITYISDRREPQHNLIRFKNCIYDMDKLDIIKPDKPVFTLVEVNYNYNPNAKSTVLSYFLETSLKKDCEEDTVKNIRCVKQLGGYLFESGNRLNILLMIVGISGGGKSVFANVLTAIFGKDKTADLKLQEIEKNTHATSSLVNKHLNIIQDSDASYINNNSLIKQITGNDSLQVNPKYLPPFVLPPEEVPKTILIGNNIPQFKHLESALIERFVIIEFNVKFRGEENEDPNLLNKILNNSEEIEWFIYQSLEEYKRMVDNGEDFILRQDGKKTRELVNKHQTPLNHVFRKIINGFSYENWSIEYTNEQYYEHKDNEDLTDEFYIYTNDLKDEIISLAKKMGIDIELNSKGDIPSKKMMEVIRNEFDLSSDYKTKPHNGKRYYPHLIPTEEYKTIFSNKGN